MVLQSYNLQGYKFPKPVYKAQKNLRRKNCKVPFVRKKKSKYFFKKSKNFVFEIIKKILVYTSASTSFIGISWENKFISEVLKYS